jgi:23S rRNA (guanosine2251-2'-O)-methyltransferase
MSFVIGTNSVLEALRAHVRVRRIVLMDGGHPAEEILSESNIQQIPIERISAGEFRRRHGTKAQGVAALLDAKPTLDPGTLLATLEPLPANIVLLLDQIQDPQNLGALFRTAEAAGIWGVILSRHKTAPLSAAVFKTSAGALSHLRVCIAPSLGYVINQLKKTGFWIVGTDAQGGQDLYSGNLTFPLALIVGSEGWGVRPLLLDQCDFLIKIPMMGKVSSLNVSVATGIALYEIRRQQKQAGLLNVA